MILSTTKKATAIYRLISSLFLLSLITQSFAQEDLASFCFPKSTNLKSASDSLGFLLLPKERIFPRPQDNCFDVTTSTDRAKLLEKFLRKRYTLISEMDGINNAAKVETQHCQIEFTTKRTKNRNSKEIQIGVQNNTSAGSDSVQELSTASLLLGVGKTGSLELEGRSLFVECNTGAPGIFNLVFSYSELYRAKVSSSVTLRSNEPLEVAQIINDLNEKSKTLGLPQTQYYERTGAEKISYELKVR